MRTKREIYDIVRAHLLAQGEPALLDTECVYRGANGTRCALGVLIPDELYRPELENSSPFESNGSGALVVRRFERPGWKWAPVLEAVPEIRAYPSMLYALQRLHDTGLGRTDWAEYITRGCNKIGLEEFGLDQQDVCGVPGGAP